ncbi:MAG: 5'-3' exonuclease [Pseudonocardiaceae bacterium]
MSRLPLQQTLPMPTFDGTGGQVPLLLVDGHNLLWGATFGFPAPIYSRDKTRLLTGLFAFFALLRVAIRDDVPGAAPEVIVVFDGEHGAASRQQAHDGYKASRPKDDQALLPLQFLPDVKRGLDHCGIAWIELEYAEADDVIATVVHTTTAPRQVIIMSRDRDYYQLITDRVVVLNTRFRAGRKLVTPQEVYIRHQVTPAQWADFRALSGDAADEIPGVHGIGAKTAATLLHGGLTLDDLPCSGRLATGRARAVAEQFELALKWRDMIRLNTGLELSRWPTGEASPQLPRPAYLVEQLGLW